MEYLLPHDEIKFVICNRQDYDWCCLKIDELQLSGKVNEILFSPSQGELAPKQLAEWILADRLNVRMQLQTHKFIWGDKPGH
jgi:7-carboxy-7-deazaguanine synthase